MCAASMAFIEDSAPQKNTGRQLSTRIFCGTGFCKRQEKNCKEKKKDDFFAFSLLRGKHRLS
jgi:hypothetical protein